MRAQAGELRAFEELIRVRLDKLLRTAQVLGGRAALRLSLGRDVAPIDLISAFDSIWIADIHANEVRRYDPTTMAEQARIPVSGGHSRPGCVKSRSPAGERDCDHGEVNPVNPIRLAVVDDHPAVALAVEAAVRSDAGSPAIELVGTARNLEAGLALVRTSGAAAPTVVICDVQLEAGIDGLGVVAAARAAGCRAIVLTSFDRASLMRAAFERGASGFLDKSAEVDDILRAVRVVAAGGTAFSAQALDAARTSPRAPSDREIAVLRLLAGGASSDEIGARLGISTRTVESHLRRMFDRYGVVSRTELAVLALREGWVEVSGT